MLNEFVYCPRLAYLEWVQGDFADSADTVDGRRIHRRVDHPGGRVPEATEDDAETKARAVDLSAPSAGLICKIDVLEGDAGTVTPVDFKRGAPPDIPGGVRDPERVQLCAQGLVLEENGYRTKGGVIYYAAARRRVAVPFDDALRAQTRTAIESMRTLFELEQAPPPLEDSPKCPRCSLVGICLPDELTALRRGDQPTSATEVRRLVPARDDALPVYVHTAGTRIGKKGDELVIEPREGSPQTARLGQTSHVATFGAVQVSTQAIHELCDREIPLVYFSAGGWLRGITQGLPHKNVELRRSQVRAADSPTRALGIARTMISAKIRNCRTMLRRNAAETSDATLDRLRELALQVDQAPAIDTLLGLEGTAARIYFQQFATMLRPAETLVFDFNGRNRRPPLDPINALLSLSYALLTKDLLLAATIVGLDPYLGFLHQPRYGRPALALDLMEEFRPIIADSVVLSVINMGIVTGGDFIKRGPAVALQPAGRARFISAYERRMDDLITHPIFGYRISYRRILEVQARLLSRHLMGELTEYPGFMTR
jgi:CRISPR-associated protein Cas1